MSPLALDDITTSGGALDNSALLYGLAYAEVQELRPYAQVRWSTPPAQLVRQRLLEQVSLRRPVFNVRDGVAINRTAGDVLPLRLRLELEEFRTAGAVLPLRLRLELEEFSHLFMTPDASVGLIRLRATLVAGTALGEKFIG